MKDWLNSPMAPADDPPACGTHHPPLLADGYPNVYACPAVWLRGWTYAIDGIPTCTGKDHTYTCTETFKVYDDGRGEPYGQPALRGTATRVVTITAPTTGPELGLMQVSKAGFVLIHLHPSQHTTTTTTTTTTSGPNSIGGPGDSNSIGGGQA